MSLLSIKSMASCFPESTAIIYKQERITYTDLLHRSEMIAGLFLAAGLNTGDRIVVHSGNHPDLIAVYYACLMTGAVIVPLNLHLISKDCRQIIKDCTARFYVGDLTRYCLCQNAIDAAASLERRWILGSRHCPEGTWPLSMPPGNSPLPLLLDRLDSTQPASIFFTSGTTGHPKGFLFSRNFQEGG